MKRVILATVSTVASLVMILSFKTHSPSAAATPPAAVSTNTNTGTGSSSPTTTSAAAAKTYTGGAANTRYGPVQVQIVVRNGKLTKASAIDYPLNSPLDAQINSYAIPQLNSEAMTAGSASIDMVSGATYTSEGYIASLQDAINQAGL